MPNNLLRQPNFAALVTLVWLLVALALLLQYWTQTADTLFDTDDAMRLALALDRMPGRLIVHAIEAADLTQGTGLTPPVAASLDEVASAILGDIHDGCTLS